MFVDSLIAPRCHAHAVTLCGLLAAGVAGTRRIVNLAEVLRECNGLAIGGYTFECKSHAFGDEVKVREVQGVLDQRKSMRFTCLHTPCLGKEVKVSARCLTWSVHKRSCKFASLASDELACYSAPNQ